MKTTNLTKSNLDITISSTYGKTEIGLPEEIKTSIELRGKKAINFRLVEYYLDESQERVYELQVLCSKCRKWTGTYRLNGDKWEYINTEFRTSICRKTGELYFADKCISCYSKTEKIVSKAETFNTNILSKKAVDYAEIKAEVDNDRIQQTIFLSNSNEEFIRLYCAQNKLKKNKLLNEIIIYYKESHPLKWDYSK